jgi:membrane protease YdiL (CAAX protease family)
MSNTGISILAFLNLFLFGVFASLYMIRSGSIFGVCALHSAWNFAQGNVFGIRVSGMNISHSLLQSEINYDRALTNGGEFGAEGGVAVTLALLIAIMLVVYLPQRKKETQVK